MIMGSKMRVIRAAVSDAARLLLFRRPSLRSMQPSRRLLHACARHAFRA
jgi:hypothetical protein